MKTPIARSGPHRPKKTSRRRHGEIFSDAEPSLCALSARPSSACCYSSGTDRGPTEIFPLRLSWKLLNLWASGSSRAGLRSVKDCTAYRLMPRGAARQDALNAVEATEPALLECDSRGGG